MPPFYRELECTGYCSCGYCCNWEWGMVLPGPFYIGFSPKGFPLRLHARKPGAGTKLPLFARQVLDGNRINWLTLLWVNIQRESPCPGCTDKGSSLGYDTIRMHRSFKNHCYNSSWARPPILSKDGLMQKEKVLGRLLLPWRVFPRHGTIAADTRFYPFGTRMYIPGYGWGEVEDKGGAIGGPDKIDLYHATHADALHWGRRKLQVKIILPGEDRINRLKVPGALKDILKGLAWIYNILF